MLGLLLVLALAANDTPTTAAGANVCATISAPPASYYVRATALDSEGNESALSNQVVKSFPGEVCWTNPTENVDGTALTDLTMVRVYYDTQPITGGSSTPPSVVVTSTCDGCPVVQASVLAVTTGQPIHITWEDATQQVELEIHKWPRSATDVPILQALASGGTYDWIPQRAGMYYHRVRVCTTCEWQNSDEEGYLYSVKLAAPVPGGIDP